MVAFSHHPGSPAPFVPEVMDRLDPPAAPSTVPWLWHGLVARGKVTLLTSVWKAGKTTLLTGLLRELGTDPNGGWSSDSHALPKAAARQD